MKAIAQPSLGNLEAAPWSWEQRVAGVQAYRGSLYALWISVLACFLGPLKSWTTNSIFVYSLSHWITKVLKFLMHNRTEITTSSSEPFIHSASIYFIPTECQSLPPPASKAQKLCFVFGADKLWGNTGNWTWAFNKICFAACSVIPRTLGHLSCQTTKEQRNAPQGVSTLAAIGLSASSLQARPKADFHLHRGLQQLMVQTLMMKTLPMMQWPRLGQRFPAPLLGW